VQIKVEQLGKAVVGELLNHYLNDQATQDSVTQFVVSILQRPEVNKEVVKLVNNILIDPTFIQKTNKLGTDLVSVCFFFIFFRFLPVCCCCCCCCSLSLLERKKQKKEDR